MRPKPGTRADKTKRRKSAVRTPAPLNEHLYLQVARTLKKEIVGGVYPVGSQLPTEDHLCERFSVSRFTVREALGRLREDNLVSSRKGARTIVVPGRSVDAYTQDVMSINDLLVFATGARFVIESMKMVLIDEKLASLTGLASGEEWLRVRGCRQMPDADLPFCWTEYFINREFAAVGRLLERHTGPVFPLIEDMFGQSIVEVHLEISAVLISRTLSENLKVEAGSPALEARCAFKTSDDTVAQVSISTHPASRYRHSMTMRRAKG
jgi:DNA-binding GntR family transcriptional regulator